jgi:prolyl-tRNA editing enzyme YbaK/EbsC (Cys-tRNA(Pro) deacylase)
VQDALHALGLPADVRELDASTRTAPEAAAAVGCELGAIVKSLVFRGTTSGDAVLVLVSGDNRADEARIEAEIGEPVGRADADWVREVTGYAIGGVPPVGHPAPVRTVVDADLLRFETVWAAAGTPRTVFPVAPAELTRAADGALAAVGTRMGPA